MLRAVILDSKIATIPPPVVHQLPTLSFVVSTPTMSDIQNTDYKSPRIPTINSVGLNGSGLSLSPRDEIRRLPSLQTVLCRGRLDRTLQESCILKSNEIFVTNVLDANTTVGSQQSQLAKRDQSCRDRGNSCEKRVQKIKFCEIDSCLKRAKTGGLCIAHGGGSRCSNEGCCKHAVTLGRCISHGGGKRCAIAGCGNASRKQGVCWSHGGKLLCKYEGCAKGPKLGGLCWSHNKSHVANSDQ